MLAVALHGQDPAILRRVRVPGGWHSQGLGAAHPAATPPKPWVQIGRCWDGVEHPVADVTQRQWPTLSQPERLERERYGMWLTWLTCAPDGLEHAVTDEAFAVAYRQDSGIYQAVCGPVVAVLPMISPPGRRCRERVDAAVPRAPRRRAR